MSDSAAGRADPLAPLRKAIAFLIGERAALIERQRSLETGLQTAFKRIREIEVLTTRSASPECDGAMSNKPSGVGKLHRGANNLDMASYAGSVGAKIVNENDQRCPRCGHTNSKFVQRRSQRICQVCFAQGVRF